LSEGLTQFPGDLRSRQLLALALARTGASHTANEILDQLAREGHVDEETLGLLARTHKDLWADSVDARDRHHHLKLAFEHYREAYRLSGGHWSGINAATMALLLDDQPTAIDLARAVRDRCLRIRNAGLRSTESYWIFSTLGEAALILREWGEAEEWYLEASAVGRGRWGDLASTRRNARLVLRYLGVDSTFIDASLRIPSVVVFAGHRIDHAERDLPRFPAALEPAVRMAIRDRLQKVQAGFGYASAACGADILFLETLLELNGEARIVLPYNREQFLKDSVDSVAGADWAMRYERVLDLAAEVVTASEHPMAGGRMSYEYGFRLMDGMAAVRADELDAELTCLAVWDGRPGDGPGGTATSVEHWQAAGRHLEIIDLAEILRSQYSYSTVDSASTDASRDITPAPSRAPSAFEPQIVALLFADAPGFSKLSEGEIPMFVEHFLGTVARELASSAQAPVFSNTWGDGLYFVFDDLRHAGQFGLRLSEAVRRADWIAKGFSHELTLRIGLHAGPAYACIDPVTGRPNYLGVHVSRAARIEPITPPGHVYASGAFAALARSAQIQDFKCVYVGKIPQAKGYGIFPTYVVQRHRSIASPAHEKSSDSRNSS
jgi:class 3 adenylate cyclase